MPNPPTYLEEIMVIETMKPMNKLQKKKLAEMKKVLSKGNVLSPEQKKEIEAMMADIPAKGMDTVGLAMNTAKVSGDKDIEAFGLDEIALGPNTAKSSERYNREAKKGEASEADFNQKMDADSQVGMKNVFDLDKEDRAAEAAAMLKTQPVVR